MVFKVYQAALFLVKLESEFPAGPAIEYQLRVQFINYDFLEYIIVELSKLHLAKDQPHAIKLNKAFAAMSNASALYLRFFELNEEFPLARFC